MYAILLMFCLRYCHCVLFKKERNTIGGQNRMVAEMKSPFFPRNIIMQQGVVVGLRRSSHIPGRSRTANIKSNRKKKNDKHRKKDAKESILMNSRLM
uniref:Putative secreted protein n=1 Tax=Anopheles darlingi TaxID=43151 RepID=A0A2M4DHN2_ANODA